MSSFRSVDGSFWKGKRVFITGHTGFKGSWISLWLQSLGSEVKGYALEPEDSPALFFEAKIGDNMISEFGDIRDFNQLKKSMVDFNPHILIHMAAQPLVRLSYDQPLETYSTNVMGTANVLEAARSCAELKAIVSVTTDKCYENKEWVWGYRETDPMGGHDPYSSSKGCAELVTSAYRRSFFHSDSSPSVATARAGNVIGGGDFSVDRLIPDILKAFQQKQPVIIRNPHSTRPWQHVLEPLSGYLILAEDLFLKGARVAEAWNFGPQDESCRPVSYVLDKMVTLWGEGAMWNLDTKQNPHEANLLKLDCSKAKEILQWYPKWDLDYSLKQTIDWHQNWLNQHGAQEKCLEQIKEYMQN